MFETLSYPMLFLASFLSSTLLPLASEAFVLAFIKFNFNPYLVLFIATLGNTLGSLSTYTLAFLGKQKILEKYFSNSLKKLEKLSINFNRFGAIFSFLSFLPIVGDIFVLGLGFAKYSLIRAIIFITLGKLSRYIFIIFIANSF
ncbi:DedA family protein [Campylobacter novaezeelandiae]|uniref:DedA family protein n=1 Tax=Campylobacter novaezeelandiae TaxID=2267891 RepID=A0A4Q9JWX5_9BACT|nr:YqaA family protein [Campylobacter novaezeelandiae]MBK1963905.1 DedA family protein [Campylobacter novaezeelandiae]MBK1993166.1 DedA family protein [Campylobacter novaezeelandiae]QWU80633.1 membrane protein YqaA, SNARE-associated domain [Campylobacter novaezeelandiae]TBR78347.1 DedA family protein [Campylobacter novaezeelandiae]TBR79686.1 DedA family protein [Campylobacter novaezeelandiae]